MNGKCLRKNSLVGNIVLAVLGTSMDVPEGAYGAYAYAPGVGLSKALD